MNERIKELAEQAGVFEGVFTKHGGVPCDLKAYGMLEDEMEKFVELIVKKCADVAKYYTPDTEECEHTWLIHDKIKQHFGVEE
jgi:hypothetical protein